MFSWFVARVNVPVKARDMVIMTMRAAHLESKPAENGGIYHDGC